MTPRGRGRVRVGAGERTHDLYRLPSLTAKDGAPTELVNLARDIIERGRLVTVRPLAGRRLITAAGGGALLAGGAALLAAPAVSLLVALPVALVGLGGMAFALSSLPTYGSRLCGRKVAGAGRESVELWRTAVEEVEAGTRAEETLPELHRLLLDVVEAEDKVNRLVSRAKYDLDQSSADLARNDLSRLLAPARALLGLAPETVEPVPYLANRWAETEQLSVPEPIHPEDLR